MLEMFKKFAETKKEEPVQETSSGGSTITPNIHNAQISDFVLFGKSDLKELNEEYCEVKFKHIFDKNNDQDTYLFLESMNEREILVDNFSEKNHIYVYQQLSYEEQIEDLISHDDDAFLSHLDTNVEDYEKFTFNQETEQDSESLWLSTNQIYYTAIKEIVNLHVTDNNDYNVEQESGEPHMYYVFQTEDGEYRFMIKFDQTGITKFYSGRRIEPDNIQRVIRR